MSITLTLLWNVHFNLKKLDFGDGLSILSIKLMRVSSKTKKIMNICKNSGKLWFIPDSSNLLREILNFPTLKIHKNQTDNQNNLNPFLCDRGDQIIKSQETLGHNYSPILNKIVNLPPLSSTGLKGLRENL